MGGVIVVLGGGGLFLSFVVAWGGRWVYSRAVGGGGGYCCMGGGGLLLLWERNTGGVFLLEVQYSILKSLISTCVLSYVGSREDWLLDRICESKKDCWDSIRRTSYPYQ